MSGHDPTVSPTGRILLTRLRYLGDVILTIPAVEALRECLPDAEIHYLAERPCHEALLGHPALDGVIPLGRGLAGQLRALRLLRRLRFDAAIDLFYNPRSANLLRLAGIPVRVGGGRKWRRRLYTHVVDRPPADPGAIAHHLRFVEEIGCPARPRRPRVHLDPTERRRGAALAAAVAPPGGGPIVAMHPGGTWPAKRWPPGRFAALARRAADSLGARVVFVAGPGEEAIAAESARETGRVLPRLSVRELAGALAACDAAVCNDGGVMHLSVALGVPTVGVFGPTEPEIWFPYEGFGPYRVVSRREECAPCHRHECDDPRCLERIDAHEVLGVLREVLS